MFSKRLTRLDINPWEIGNLPSWQGICSQVLDQHISHVARHRLFLGRVTYFVTSQGFDT